MSFFDKKQEVGLEDFCRNFYDKFIINPTLTTKKGEKIDVAPIMYETFRNSVIEADNCFANIGSQKFDLEMMLLRFELFALAWLHKFGVKLAVTQSIFTKDYLHEKGRDDIWDAMGHYTKATSHATTVEKNKTEKGKIDLAHIYKMRMDSADEAYDWAEKAGYDIKDVQFIGSINTSLNRLGSENAWKKGVTAYFLILALCHRFGLSYGTDYLGPNKKAQLRLEVIIRGFYKGAQQSWDKVKIKS